MEEDRAERINLYIDLLKKKTALPILLVKPFRKRAADMSDEELNQRIQNLKALCSVKGAIKMKRVKFQGNTKVDALIEYLHEASGEEGVIFCLEIVDYFNGGPSIADNYIRFDYEVEPIKK